MDDFTVVRRQRSGHLDGVLPLFIIAQLPDAKGPVALFDHQTGQRGEIAELFRPGIAGDKRRRGAEDAVIAGKLAGYQIGRDIVADANIQIDPFISQIYQLVGDVETDLQLRIATGQLGERRRDHPPTKAKAADDPQRPLRHLPHIGELIHHLVDILQNA